MMVEGEGMQTSALTNLNAQAAIRVTQHKDAAFIKDWSENAPVFFSLLRLPKARIGDGVNEQPNPVEYSQVLEEVTPEELVV